MVDQGYHKQIHFFCKGKCIAGPDLLYAAATVIIIIFAVCLFGGGVGAYYFLYTPLYVSIPIEFLCIFFAILCLIFFFLTSCMDPGIIPKQRKLTIEEEFKGSRPNGPFQSQPMYQYVFLRGEKTRLKYCYTCHLYRPLRASHCSRCDNCVEKWDHHCPWVGTCVGKRNYRFFTIFLYISTIAIIGGILASLAQIAVLANHIKTHQFDVAVPEAVGLAILYSPPAVITVIFFLFLLGFAGTMCIYHSFLACINQTTYERLRRSQFRFSKGVFRNCAELYCTKIPKSKIKLDRELQNPQDIEQTPEAYRTK